MLVLCAVPAFSQEVEKLNFEQFEKRYLEKREDDTLYVINFWATWCKPCVAELPSFEAVNKKFASKPVKVVLVSLDFADKIDSQLKPFLYYRKMESKVILLDAPHENEWIPKVSESWTGPIPATLMIQPSSGFKKFYESMFEEQELENEINENLKICEK